MSDDIFARIDSSKTTSFITLKITSDKVLEKFDKTVKIVFPKKLDIWLKKIK